MLSDWLHVQQTDYIRLITSDWIHQTDYIRLITSDWLHQTDYIRLITSDWLTDYIRMMTSDWLHQTNYISQVTSAWLHQPDYNSLITTAWLHQTDYIRLITPDWLHQADYTRLITPGWWSTHLTWRRPYGEYQYYLRMEQVMWCDEYLWTYWDGGSVWLSEWRIHLLSHWIRNLAGVWLQWPCRHQDPHWAWSWSPQSD